MLTNAIFGLPSSFGVHPLRQMQSRLGLSKISKPAMYLWVLIWLFFNILAIIDFVAVNRWWISEPLTMHRTLRKAAQGCQAALLQESNPAFQAGTGFTRREYAQIFDVCPLLHTQRYHWHLCTMFTVVLAQQNLSVKHAIAESSIVGQKDRNMLAAHQAKSCHW